MAITRRNALKASLLGGAGVAAAGTIAATTVWRSSTSASAFASAPQTRDAETALNLLQEGNERWISYASLHPDEVQERRQKLTTGQDPFATILGCADSRVPPELIFDQGLGDLFTIRSVGEVLDESVLGSLSYAAQHLNTPLFVVLGHQSCGAVTAAVEAHEAGEVPSGHIGYVVEQILGVVDSTPDDGEDFIDACVRANAAHVAEQLRADDDLRDAVDSGRIEIVPARYDLKTSRVTWL